MKNARDEEILRDALSAIDPYSRAVLERRPLVTISAQSRPNSRVAGMYVDGGLNLNTRGNAHWGDHPDRLGVDAWYRINDEDTQDIYNRESWLDLIAAVWMLEDDLHLDQQAQPAAQWGMSHGWLDIKDVDGSLARALLERGLEVDEVGRARPIAS